MMIESIKAALDFPHRPGRVRLVSLMTDGFIGNETAILETIADHVGRTRDPETLTEMVRQRLGRALCELHADNGGTVYAVTLDPAIEARLAG